MQGIVNVFSGEKGYGQNYPIFNKGHFSSLNFLISLKNSICFFFQVTIYSYKLQSI